MKGEALVEARVVGPSEVVQELLEGAMLVVQAMRRMPAWKAS